MARFPLSPVPTLPTSAPRTVPGHSGPYRTASGSSRPVDAPRSGGTRRRCRAAESAETLVVARASTRALHVRASTATRLPEPPMQQRTLYRQSRGMRSPLTWTALSSSAAHAATRSTIGTLTPRWCWPRPPRRPSKRLPPWSDRLTRRI